MNVPVWHDPDAPTEAEAAQRLLFFREMASYWGVQRLEALMARDDQRERVAREQQAAALRLTGRWCRILADAQAAGMAAA